MQNGVTVNFSGHNAAKFIMNVHGHNHCFQYGKLHSVANGQGTEFDAWRMCTPNACFYRNNSGVVTMNGISFGDPAPYDKTAGTGDDTAFNVNVINPSEQVLYSFCYGAGIDRTIGYAATVYHSITNALTNVTTSNDTVAAEDGTSYTATLTAKSGYTLGEVTVKMGGTDITATVYNANTGVINISKVTGDVVVTAKATKIVSYHNLVPKAVDTSGHLRRIRMAKCLALVAWFLITQASSPQALYRSTEVQVIHTVSGARASNGTNTVLALRGTRQISR